MTNAEKMNIQWYPGHMTKTRRQIEADLKQVDAVCEIVDARIPMSSRNPDIDAICGSKPRIIVLNRMDLADPAVTKKWMAHFKKKGYAVIATDCKTKKGIADFNPAARMACKEKIERDAARGMNRPVRVMVVGIPNVGKSTLINQIAGRKGAKAENRPGVTRGKQWVTVDAGLQLMDTPGILWPKFEDPQVGMSPNVRKKRTYDDLDYNMLEKTLDISAISFHKMLQVAKKQDAIAEYGSVVALTYVAAQRTFFGYNDMADAKSLLESIARSFGYIYGREKNVRINTISQSPTPTTAGNGVKGMEHLMDFANKMSPLGNADAEECANYCVMMFSDFTRKVTMQNLYHDGGFSSMGMSLRAMNQYSKGFEEYTDENGHIIYG